MDYIQNFAVKELVTAFTVYLVKESTINCQERLFRIFSLWLETMHTSEEGFNKLA